MTRTIVVEYVLCRSVVGMIMIINEVAKERPSYVTGGCVTSVMSRDSSGVCTTLMKVIATYHHPSSVLDSIKCILSGEADTEFLVVAKLNRVDFYSIHPEGLRYENGIEIWGRVRAVRSIQLRVRDTAVQSFFGYRLSPLQHRAISVLVLTDHPEPDLVFLSFTLSRSGASDLTVKKRLSLFQRNARPAEFFHDVIINYSGRFAVVSVYTARLLIVLLDDKGQYEGDVDTSCVCSPSSSAWSNRVAHW